MLLRLCGFIVFQICLNLVLLWHKFSLFLRSFFLTSLLSKLSFWFNNIFYFFWLCFVNNHFAAFLYFLFSFLIIKLLFFSFSLIWWLFDLFNWFGITWVFLSDCQVLLWFVFYKVFSVPLLRRITAPTVPLLFLLFFLSVNNLVITRYLLCFLMVALSRWRLSSTLIRLHSKVSQILITSLLSFCQLLLIFRQLFKLLTLLRRVSLKLFWWPARLPFLYHLFFWLTLTFNPFWPASCSLALHFKFRP